MTSEDGSRYLKNGLCWIDGVKNVNKKTITQKVHSILWASQFFQARTMVELASWPFAGGGGNSTIAKIHQNHFQAISDRFGNFSKFDHLQWGGGELNHAQTMKVS